MGKCCQMVMGPAGTGKSTYCHTMQEHCANARRRVLVANLDPAAEGFDYEVVALDIRDLISVTDVMEELELGPNGALVYCMEYLLDNMEWLQEELGEFDDEDYIIFDCPGQVELYSHIPVMRQVLDQVRLWGYQVCGVFTLDATFMTDASKFISGTLLCLSAMVQLEVPHINVLTKCDLVDREELDRFLEVDTASLLQLHDRACGAGGGYGGDLSRELNDRAEGREVRTATLPKQARLTAAIAAIIDDYTMVNYIPLDINDEESIGLVMQHADHTIQYGEDLEPKEPCDEVEEEEEEAG
ncbi:unnamed protein product [Chrysoparadoxa australica]